MSNSGPVVTAARGEVIERYAQAICAQKPGEGLPHALQIVPVTGDRMSAAKRQYEGRGIDGLLVGTRLLAAAAVPACVADQLQLIASETDAFQEFQRLPCIAQAAAVARDSVGCEQRER
jgi:hypothetical protein